MRSRACLPWISAGTAVCALLLPLAAKGFDPFLTYADPQALGAAPAYRYAQMSSDQALAELRARGALFQQSPPVRGVVTPVRLTGRLRGVHIHTALPESLRPTTPFEICDARLALALDDFAAILAKHDVDELVHYSMFRPASPLLPARHVPSPNGLDTPAAGSNTLPPLPAPDAPQLPIGVPQDSGPLASHPALTESASRPPPDRLAPPSQPATSAVAAASRHPAGLAIDVAMLHKRNGEWLKVGAHFGGHIGAPTCGPGAATPTDEKMRELRVMVCEAFDARIFTYVLTPNYNYAHRDHFHMEIKSGVRWFLVH